jgi:hypothetical protein
VKALDKKDSKGTFSEGLGKVQLNRQKNLPLRRTVKTVQVSYLKIRASFGAPLEVRQNYLPTGELFEESLGPA